MCTSAMNVTKVGRTDAHEHTHLVFYTWTLTVEYVHRCYKRNTFTLSSKLGRISKKYFGVESLTKED